MVSLQPTTNTMPLEGWIHTLTDFNVTTLGYNPANQIIRRSVTDSSMQAAMPSSAPDLYTPNNLNQYTFVDTNNPLYYDDNGNLTDYDGWDYGYDAHNRMQSASRPGSTSLNLAYDPTGRLSSTELQGSTTNFSYSGDQLIGEYNSSGNQTNLYVYAPGSDIPIARFSGGSIGPNNVTYLRADERGSIVLETDGTTVLESHQYDVYGVPLNVSDSLFRYTGQIQLKGTELYHYKARAYHPELGRFLQTDPIGYDDGMNMYAYVGNDPVNGVDPSGTQMLEANKLIWAMYGLDIMEGDTDGTKEKERTWGSYLPGTEAGDRAAQYWADIAVGSDHPLAPLAHVPGGIAALWTEETSANTAFTLGTASLGSVTHFAKLGYFRYVGPESNPASKWLLVSTSSKAPYSSMEVAKDALQLPHMPTTYQAVKIPFWKPVVGPRPASGNGQWGRGGGPEWWQGWRFPD